MVAMKDMKPVPVPTVVPDTESTQLEYEHANMRRIERIRNRKQDPSYRSLLNYQPSLILESRPNTLTPTSSFTATSKFILPEHTNPYGITFGGQVMHWMDVCAWLCSARHTRGPVVLASMDRLNFINPTKPGDVLSVRSVVNKSWGASIEVYTAVETKGVRDTEPKLCNDAYLTFVSVDSSGKSVKVPTLVPETEEEKAYWTAADSRRKWRLQERLKLQNTTI